MPSVSLDQQPTKHRVTKESRNGGLKDSNANRKSSKTYFFLLFLIHAQRLYRFGAGIEVTVGEFDIPGFDLREVPGVVEENGGFHKMLKFLCARNDRRMNQCSWYLTQLWIGDTDVKVLIYDSYPW
jgi:hypothetical protein